MKEFSQAASKETLALEFRANCVETQNMCSISQMTNRVEEEKNRTVISSAFSYEFKFSDFFFFYLLEIFGKADVPAEPSFIHFPLFVHFSRMRIYPVL